MTTLDLIARSSLAPCRSPHRPCLPRALQSIAPRDASALSRARSTASAQLRRARRPRSSTLCTTPATPMAALPRRRLHSPATPRDPPPTLPCHAVARLGRACGRQHNFAMRAAPPSSTLTPRRDASRGRSQAQAPMHRAVSSARQNASRDLPPTRRRAPRSALHTGSGVSCEQPLHRRSVRPLWPHAFSRRQ
jgi:hypothetical protein